MVCAVRQASQSKRKVWAHLERLADVKSPLHSPTSCQNVLIACFRTLCETVPLMAKTSVKAGQTGMPSVVVEGCGSFAVPSFHPVVSGKSIVQS
jgi:hypothetical protein